MLARLEVGQGRPKPDRETLSLLNPSLHDPDSDPRVFDVLLGTASVLLLSLVRQDLHTWGGALQAVMLIANMGVLVWFDGTLVRSASKCWNSLVSGA